MTDRPESGAPVSAPVLLNRSLIAIIASITVTGVGLGATGPLLGLLMNDMGWPRTLIGIVTAMPAIAAIAASPLSIFFLRRIKLIPFIHVNLVLTVIALALFKFFPNFWTWCLIRFCLGLGLAGVFIATELWINLLADDRNRGRLMGIYGTCLAGGIALGAGMLAVTGVEGWPPFIAAIVPMVCAGVLLTAMGVTSPHVRQDELPDRFLHFIPLAPIAMGAALIFGAIEMGILSLLPVYGVRSGLSVPMATALTISAAAGNLLCQIPIGILADRFDKRLVMLVCTALALLLSILIPFFVGLNILLFTAVFLLGGVTLGMYTVGLTLLGQQFSGSTLVAANAAFIAMYGVGSLFGPPAAGGAMDIWDPHGLMAVLALLSAVYVILTGITIMKSARTGTKRSSGPATDA